MKKRPYQEPTTEVVKLEQPYRLLAGSDGELEPLPPFTPGEDPLGGD